LGDVSVSDSKPIYAIHIVSLQPTRDNRPLGVVAVSVLVKRPLGRNYLDMWLKGKVEPGIIEALAKYYTNNIGEVEAHSIVFGSLSELPELCRSVVTDFDAGTLIPARKVYHDFIEQQKELERQRKD
jgi:hypothetical protein